MDKSIQLRLEAVTEALEWDKDIIAVLAQPEFEPMVLAVEVLIDTARAVVEAPTPDIEAAWVLVRLLVERGGVVTLEEVTDAVDAAFGGSDILIRRTP